MAEFNFDDIRPYNEIEAKEALQRIIGQPELQTILEYLFGKEEHIKFLKIASEATSINDFQKNFMNPLVKKILENTSSGITTSGFEALSTGIQQLFIANHRDITLDSSILQTILVERGYEACENTWGDNLLVSPFITDLGKINRMVTVFREGKPRETLFNAQKLSAYIRKRITKDHHSVWIAQRKGRTKDGNDKTNVGVLKMLSLAGKEDLLTSLLALNITPISVSYEWEPCDAVKLKEIYISQSKDYVKKQDEDLKSIMGGILGEKGHIHLGLGESINAKIQQLDNNIPNNEFLQKVAVLIDIEIYRNYHLWPNNFLAYDLLYQTHQFADRYTGKTQKELTERMEKAVAEKEGDKSEAVKMFFRIYAQPVINKLKHNLPIDLPQLSK